MYGMLTPLGVAVGGGVLVLVVFVFVVVSVGGDEHFVVVVGHGVVVDRVGLVVLVTEVGEPDGRRGVGDGHVVVGDARDVVVAHLGVGGAIEDEAGGEELGQAVWVGRADDVVVRDLGGVDTRVDVGAHAAAVGRVVGHDGLVGLHAQADLVGRHLVLRDGDVRLVVHADGDEVQRLRVHLVARDDRLLRPDGEDAVLGPVPDRVIADERVLGAHDGDVETREAVHLEALALDVLDVGAHLGDRPVLAVEVTALHVGARDADAGLRVGAYRRLVAGKVRARVLRESGRRDDGRSGLPDELDALVDRQLLAVHALGDGDLVTGAGAVDCRLDALARLDRDLLGGGQPGDQAGAQVEAAEFAHCGRDVIIT